MKLDLLVSLVKQKLESNINMADDQVNNLSDRMNQATLNGSGIVGMDGIENFDLTDLPTSLIITNVDVSVFEDESSRVSMQWDL